MRVRPFLMIQFLSTLIRGRELRHFRSPKCPAPGTSGPLFFSKVQNATCQNGSGGLVVPRIFGQTDIGFWKNEKKMIADFFKTQICRNHDEN